MKSLLHLMCILNIGTKSSVKKIGIRRAISSGNLEELDIICEKLSRSISLLFQLLISLCFPLSILINNPI